MSIDKVSFGSIIDVKYRYRLDDVEGKARASRKCRTDGENVSSDILCRVREVDTKTKSPEFAYFHSANRLITGEDKEIYLALSKMSHKVADTYINDNVSNTFVINV